MSIVRAYITGSMWKAYAQGERNFCGNKLPDGLTQYQQLPGPILTPTTKGTLDITGIPTSEDANITHDQIRAVLADFGFHDGGACEHYRHLIPTVFERISNELASKGQLLADAKFEIGYFCNGTGHRILGLIDEPITPDSARIWSGHDYNKGKIVERSKESFRKYLKEYCAKHVKPHGTNILDGGPFLPQLKELAATHRIPVDTMMEVSKIYGDLTHEITGKPVPTVTEPREEILQTLSDYGLLR
ncbi:hypothetical protein HY641_04530 [Candidatus Woesearchaeota archaeon]|nr:hypothetical protein [Candidatus Woesearchaeota archaeon]